MRRPAAVSLLIAAVAVAMLLPSPASGARVDVRATGDVAVQGADTMRYRLRLAYAVPSSWRPIGRRRGLTRRFGPIGSCRIRVTLTAAVAADVPEDPVARTVRLLPAGAPGVYDYGTRTNGAYRVARRSGTGELQAVLVKPATTVKQQPAPRILWIEMRARARIDPRTECHSGGPRTVGQQLGDTFAAARVGGFQL
jgi:hypothetical protein